MGASTGSGLKAEINLAPLIDIVLVVLIIMMVNIPIQIEEMTVKLPKSETTTTNKPPPADQLVVALYENGDMALNRRLMTEEVLTYELMRRLRPMTEKNVFVDAGPKVPYGRVVAVVDLARAAGAEQVGLARLKDDGPLAATSAAPGAMPRGVHPGSPKIVGAFSESRADQVLQGILPSIRGCYDQRLAVNSELSGRLSLRYAVGPEGEHLEAPRIETGATVEDPELIQCIEGYLPSLQFPPLGDQKTALVVYTLLFSPG